MKYYIKNPIRVLLLLLCNMVAASSGQKKIAIIVGGISGASTSYYITEFLKNHSMPAADITVFERRDYIGGRLKHIRFGPNNIKIEVGGAAWTDDNIYMTEMAKAVGINVTRKKIIRDKKQITPEDLIFYSTASNKRSDDDDTDSVGVWDGETIIDLEKFVLKNLGQALKVGESELQFLKQIKENYAKQASSEAPFHNLTRFLTWFSAGF